MPPDVESDEALLEQIVRHRDTAAVETLYLRYRSGLSAMAYRLVDDWQAAEEIVQDTMVLV